MEETLFSPISPCLVGFLAWEDLETPRKIERRTRIIMIRIITTKIVFPAKSPQTEPLPFRIAYHKTAPQSMPNCGAVSFQ